MFYIAMLVITRGYQESMALRFVDDLASLNGKSTSRLGKWPIDRGLPNLKMVDLSMAKC